MSRLPVCCDAYFYNGTHEPDCKGDDMKTRKPIVLEQRIVSELDPGIRALVVWLNEMGYRTCDSGDGGKYGKMEGAMPFPNVAMTSTPARMIEDAQLLRTLLIQRGVAFGGRGDSSPQIQANYDPQDMVAAIMLFNVLSTDLVKP